MTEPTDALIPCPFCGSPDVAIADDLVTFNGLCNACGASGGYSSYRNGATWLWNRRTPQPTQAQAGAVPLDEARRLFDAGWKAAALFCDREDVVADGIIGFGACPQFEAAFSAAHGIKGGQHGSNT